MWICDCYRKWINLTNEKQTNKQTNEPQASLLGAINILISKKKMGYLITFHENGMSPFLMTNKFPTNKFCNTLKFQI